ncbi:MAG TPA: RNA 2',3'-cyclic phosphodiesterase [Candidatus Pacearchaeota archaeon]|nr:RNA 2',3'-cyclic phosphodiesterase [Candidatus Pacearchaeota archaeon]
MEKIRTFVSIDLPENIQKEIKQIQNSLPSFEGKKTEPENLHLTLKFLGEIDKKKVGEIKEKLREIKFKEFETKIAYIGFFYNKKYGVVWIHLPNCEKIQEEVDEKLSSLFEKERRFMSHLTIARVKKIKNKEEFLKKLREIKFQKIRFGVKSFNLKKSTLMQEGPVYETLEEYGLS